MSMSIVYFVEKVFSYHIQKIITDKLQSTTGTPFVFATQFPHIPGESVNAPLRSPPSCLKKKSRKCDSAAQLLSFKAGLIPHMLSFCLLQSALVFNTDLG